MPLITFWRKCLGDDDSSIVVCISINHKVHIYTEYHSVCPLVGIGTLSPASVPLPPVPKLCTKMGVHSPAGEGLWESKFRRLKISLALCLLCGINRLCTEVCRYMVRMRCYSSLEVIHF
jgi:hypothetical protein